MRTKTRFTRNPSKVLAERTTELSKRMVRVSAPRPYKLVFYNEHRISRVALIKLKSKSPTEPILLLCKSNQAKEENERRRQRESTITDSFRREFLWRAMVKEQGKETFRVAKITQIHPQNQARADYVRKNDLSY